MQSVFIGLGAVLSSALPWLLTHAFQISGQELGPGGKIPLVVHLSFYAGGVIFFGAVLYTIITTKEHPPADPAAFAKMKAAGTGPMHVLAEIFRGLRGMPTVMRRLAVVQFFTWLGLFCMWIYFSPSVAKIFFGGAPGSSSYQEGIAWAGVCFSAYSVVAFLFAFVLVRLTRHFSARNLHRVCLLAAAAGFLLIPQWTDPKALLISMAGVGIGWAGILSMPYAMLANAVPPAKMGFYMGVFNFFIVLPQIVAASLLGFLVTHVFNGNGIHALTLGGGCFIIAAIALSWVKAEAPATELAEAALAGSI
jgi:maltose/moltooligosaccharide transporter